MNIADAHPLDIQLALSVLPQLFRVRSPQALVTWFMHDVRRVFRHAGCVYGLARMNGENLDIVRAHHVGMPPMPVQPDCKSPVAEAVNRWKGHIRPHFFPVHSLVRSPACPCARLLPRFEHCAVHGVGCAHEAAVSFFWFGGVEVHAQDRIAVALDLLVPHMHATLSRVWNGSNGDGREVFSVNGAPSPSVKQLTAREREVLLWMAKGKTNGEIAKILQLSAETVKTHVSRILEKLNSNNRSQAVAKAVSLFGSNAA